MAMTADEIKAAVNAYYASISAGTFDANLAMFAPGAAMHDPVGAPPATDDTGRRGRYAGIPAAFETFAVTARVLLACGSEAAAHWTAGGRTKKGRDVSFDGISTFVFDDAGKIALMRAYWEPAAMAAVMAG
jgi:ketosteroid isomerase-like protein